MSSGRTYALGRWADRAAAVVQAFFPGHEGGGAVALLSGRVEPSARLTLGVPRTPGWPVRPLSRAAAGPPQRPQQRGPHRSLPVRARPVVHHVRLARRAVRRPRTAHRR
ncbi:MULTISPECIES: glycoside hydrolase family 3 C-terminal domain-containing protein [Streptomyces]|uniref:glycoside hydrolase family 3 C-terminal domain-containing protein n=1 Tax=Streptomyces TaxID=1883 RepID=UPI002DD91A8D|nr:MULTISPECIES: glycoside hydrolase family 3 C-terminal domain-containing protein [unclassified Streptomyces]WSD93148.1 glycoside hydrolase family 3 C-terminal domain-containing protein [Streptomyces sp. NBC_01474]